MYDPTVTLYVRRRTDGGTDPFGSPLPAWGEPERVDGCLLVPGSPDGLSTDRPNGARVAATAHFPRGYSGALRGAQVSADGASWLSVVGEPQTYPDGTVRGAWATMVRLETTEG